MPIGFGDDAVVVLCKRALFKVDRVPFTPFRASRVLSSIHLCRSRSLLRLSSDDYTNLTFRSLHYLNDKVDESYD